MTRCSTCAHAPKHMQTAIELPPSVPPGLYRATPTLPPQLAECSGLEKMLIDAYKFAATLTTTVEGLQRAEGHESRQP